MNGRLEHQLVCEKQNKNILKGKPVYLRNYYRFLTASQKEETTCRTYLRYVCAFFEYLEENGIQVGKSVKKIKKEYVIDYMSSLRYVEKNGELKQASHSYRANVWAALNSFFTYCVINELIESNPMVGVQKDSAKRDHIDRIAMSPEELSTVIKNIKDKINFNNMSHEDYWKLRDLCIITMFVFTGMRVTALTEINMSDIDFETNEITIIDKGEKTHTYFLLDQMVEYLQLWIDCRAKLMYGYKKTEALFISNRRTRIADRTVRQLTYNYTKCLNYNKKISPHKFRSSYATNLYNDTGDIYFVKNCIGHSRVDTTERYIVDVKSDKAKAKDLLNKTIKI